MFVGLRVLRGPDWSSGECDGGDGHLGTVVQVDKGDGTVDVVWDNGQRRTCQAGKGGKCELRIFDNATVGSRHTSYNCKECGERGIFGMRWECKECKDVNLCPLCYVQDKHPLNHQFRRFDYPGGDGVDVRKRSTSQRVQAMGLFPLARVVRGDDWKWDKQDGGSGGKGTVVSVGRVESGSTARGLVKVRWDRQTDPTTLYLYRVGHDGKMDLKFVEESPGTYFYKEHLPVLDVTKTMRSDTDLQMLQVGDKVCIHLDDEELRVVQMDSGGWTAAMISCIGKFGTVKGFTGGGDVSVGFDFHTFRIYPGALKKVPQLPVGEVVKLITEEKKVRVLQKGHGGWNNDLTKFLGKVGKIVKKDDSGDVVVAFGQTALLLNPACCIPAPGQTVFNPGRSMRTQSLDEGPMGLHGLLLLMGAMLAMGDDEDREVSVEHLYRAIAQGSVLGVRSLLAKNKALVHEKHKDVTALILASHEGQIEIVKVILDSGADPDAQDHKGNTALMAAIIFKKVMVVKLLIERGASVKVTNTGRQTCVHLAAWANLSPILPVIIQKGGQINAQDGDDDTPLHDAILKGSKECLEILLKQKDINLRIANKRGMMALHFAAFKGNVTAVDLIIQRDKSVVMVYRPSKDYVPLHIAAANDHVEIARLLIDKGDSPLDIIGDNGRSPLHVACAEAHYRMVELLTQRHAILDLKDNDGNTSLHVALGAKRSSIFGFMLRGEVEARIRIACYLMESGATYNMKNKNRLTPKEVANHPAIKTAIDVYVEQHKRDLKARPVTPPPGGQGRSTIGLRSSGDAFTMFNFPLPCSSCFGKMSDVTLKPCGHKVLCRACCVSAQICPMCETDIERRIASDDADVDEVCKIQ